MMRKIFNIVMAFFLTVLTAMPAYAIPDGQGNEVFPNSNVGIGSLAPGQKLDVNGTVRATAFIGDGSALTGINAISGLNTGYISKASSSTAINDSGLFQSGDNIGIGTTTPQGAFVVAQGNVGIGTWAPTTPFEFLNTTDTTLRISNAGGLTDPSLQLYRTSIDAGSIYYKVGGGSNAGLHLISTRNDGAIYFHTQGSLSTIGNNQRMIIDANGNVGIATSTPQTKLSIVGGNVGIGTWTADGGNLIVNGGGNVGIATAWPGQALDVSGTVRATAFVGDGSGLTGLSGTGWTASGNDVYKTSNGNVGIGTTLTTTSALTVMNGNVGIGTWVAQNGTVEILTTQGTELYFSGASSANITSRRNLYLSAGSAATQLNLIPGGNVGIGSLIPVAALDVTGTVRATAFVGDGSGLTGISAAGWSQSGTNISTSGANNVGIGTTTPQADLVVTAGNVGIGTWTSSALLHVVQPGVGDAFRVDDAAGDTTPFLIDSVGNVGIGTTLLSNYSFNVFSGSAISVANFASTSSSAFHTALVDIWNYGVGSTGIRFINGAAGSVAWTMGADITNNSAFTIGSGLNNLGVLSTKYMFTIQRSTGNVGIGTFVSNALLDISSTAAQDLFRVNDNGTGDTTPFLIDSVGNVGIGSLTPGTALDVTGTVRATAFIGDGSGLTGLPAAGWTLGASNVGISTTNNVGIGTNLTTTAALSVMSGYVGIGTWKPSALQHIVQSSNHDAFRVDDSLGDTTPFVIDSSGRVGINSASPKELLSIFSPAAGTVDMINLYQNGGNANDESRINFSTSSGRLDGAIGVQRAGVGTKALLKLYTGSAGVLTARLAIDPDNGNVGISTTKPAALLDISSVASQSLFIINDNGEGDESPFIVNQDGNVGIGTFDPFGGRLIIPTTEGNVGIGSLTPGTVLDVTGTVRATSFSGDGSGLTGIASGWTLGASNVGISTTNNVGIGTNLTTTAALSVMSGNVGIGTWVPSSGVQLKQSIGFYRTATSSSATTSAQTIIGVTDTSANRTITLATADMAEGRVMIVKDESGGAGTNNITVATEGAETIDGQNTITITVNYGVVKVYSDGSNWFTF